jgi:thiol-disulfide isomerase/thioredoxin
MRRILLTALLLLLSVSVRAQSSSQPESLKLRDIRGRPFSLADYKGKVVLINFWATWCQPCRKEIPDLIKTQRQYRKLGLQVVGITYPPQTQAQVLPFVRKMGINYPVAFGTEQTKGIFDKSEALPITVIIDRAGKVRDVILGILFPDEFAEKIKPLLFAPR